MVSLTQRVRVSSTGLSISLSLASLAGAAMPGGPRPRARPGAPRARGGRGRGTDGTPAPWGPASEVRGAHTSMPGVGAPALSPRRRAGPGGPSALYHAPNSADGLPPPRGAWGGAGRARPRARAGARSTLSVHNPLRARAVREPQRIERLPYRPANSSRKTAKQDS
jgi:hypothetical protein